MNTHIKEMKNVVVFTTVKHQKYRSSKKNSERRNKMKAFVCG